MHGVASSDLCGVGRVVFSPPVDIRWIKRPARPSGDRQDEVVETVARIIHAIQMEGETAIRQYSRQFDDWDPRHFRVSRADVEAAYQAVNEEDVEAIRFVRDQVAAFARVQRDALREVRVEPVPGIVLGHRLVPVNSVGCYVPGGNFPLIASVLMQLVTAREAGVSRVVAVAPPRGNAMSPATLVAIDLCEADEIFCLGGIQAMAALAFGFGELEPVDMITGPGNPYVAEAKRQLFGVVGIDLLAGPTEILVIADETADPEIVAADLLAQAEHGSTSPAHLVTTYAPLAEAVLESVEAQLTELPTARTAGAAWEALGAIALVGSREDAIAYSDGFAPEHLEVITTDLDWYASRLRNYGSLFLGEEATVAYSDKAIGTNHTLPTGRAARYTGGLWVGKFIKVVTYQQLTREGSNYIAPYASRISRLEGMIGHALSGERRLDKYGGRARSC